MNQPKREKKKNKKENRTKQQQQQKFEFQRKMSKNLTNNTQIHLHADYITYKKKTDITRTLKMQYKQNTYISATR